MLFIFIRFDNVTKKKMKLQIFKILARVNKAILPSYTKQKLDISKATKFQLIIIGWRAFVTINSLN